jgi:hypothetical protein
MAGKCFSHEQMPAAPSLVKHASPRFDPVEISVEEGKPIPEWLPGNLLFMESKHFQRTISDSLSATYGQQKQDRVRLTRQIWPKSILQGFPQNYVNRL